MTNGTRQKQDTVGEYEILPRRFKGRDPRLKVTGVVGNFPEMHTAGVRCSPQLPIRRSPVPSANSPNSYGLTSHPRLQINRDALQSTNTESDRPFQPVRKQDEGSTCLNPTFTLPREDALDISDLLGPSAIETI